ncbi:MAG: polyphosphate polymerase domain-containing protein [Oscillospiraceae bacterium]|nr:polyphosphate polymerase domain-containing protein [Oscillospiraceae bacterium]
MDLRHEWKHEISYLDMLTLRQRLRAIAQADQHAIGGTYLIRSLYFDTPSDKALKEKLNGVSRREKFRIRYYNGDTSVIHLEKKSKLGGLGNKQSAVLTVPEVSAILHNDLSWMLGSGRPLVRELYSKMRTELLQPRTIVDYTREPYVYPAGNVRITLDYDIRTSLCCTNFLYPGVTIPAGDAPIILEIKWDAFLPSIIRDIIQLEGRHTSSFSKYAQCRIYG